MNTTRRSIALALHALGDTADDVADTLHAAGFRGVRYLPTDCPLARYLCAVVLDVTWAAVGGGEVTVGTTACITFDADLTPATSTFVVAFDHGDYAELCSEPDDDE